MMWRDMNPYDWLNKEGSEYCTFERRAQAIDKWLWVISNIMLSETVIVLRN